MWNDINTQNKFTSDALTPPSDTQNVWRFDRESEWSAAWEAFDAADAEYRKAVTQALSSEDEVIMQTHLLEMAKAASKAANTHEWKLRAKLSAAREAFFALDKERDLAFFHHGIGEVE